MDPISKQTAKEPAEWWGERCKTYLERMNHCNSLSAWNWWAENARNCAVYAFTAARLSLDEK